MIQNLSDKSPFLMSARQIFHQDYLRQSICEFIFSPVHIFLEKYSLWPSPVIKTDGSIQTMQKHFSGSFLGFDITTLYCTLFSNSTSLL